MDSQGVENFNECNSSPSLLMVIKPKLIRGGKDVQSRRQQELVVSNYNKIKIKFTYFEITSEICSILAHPTFKG